MESLQKELNRFSEKKLLDLREVYHKYETEVDEFKKKFSDQLTAAKEQNHQLKLKYEDELDGMRQVLLETKKVTS